MWSSVTHCCKIPSIHHFLQLDCTEVKMNPEDCSTTERFYQRTVITEKFKHTLISQCRSKSWAYIAYCILHAKQLNSKYLFNKQLLKTLKYTRSSWNEKKNVTTNIHTICATLFIMSIVFMNGRMVCCNDLWDTFFFFIFIKDAPVYPMLKEAIKEAPNHLSLVIG